MDFRNFPKKLFMLCLFINFEKSLGYDQCKDLCKNARLPPTIPNKHQGVRVVCHRGCRFFNIIKYEFKTFSVKKTKDKCYNACASAYKFQEESTVCKKGCELMARKRMQHLSILFELPPEDDFANKIFPEPDIEKLESNVLSNPVVRQELEEGTELDEGYKIYEKPMRTIPIIMIPEPDKIVKMRDTEDWLTCASKNSGIPKWILCTVMSTAVLVAVCLNLSLIVGNRTEEEIDLDEILIDVGLQESFLRKNSCLSNEEKLIFGNYYSDESKYPQDVAFTSRTPPPNYFEISHSYDM